MEFNLNKREFRDGLGLRYDWPITDIPSTCLCGEPFTIDHAIICMKGGFIIQRHNELRDLEAEPLNMVCKDVATEPVLQDVDQWCSVFTDLTNYEDYNKTTTAFPESNTCNLNLHIVTRMLAIYTTGGWGG